MTEPLSPPVAATRPHSFTLHGHTIEDPYAWLRDPNYPEVDDADVLAYLAAEKRLFRERDGTAPAVDRPAV